MDTRDNNGTAFIGTLLATGSLTMPPNDNIAESIFFDSMLDVQEELNRIAHDITLVEMQLSTGSRQRNPPASSTTAPIDATSGDEDWEWVASSPTLSSVSSAESDDENESDEEDEEDEEEYYSEDRSVDSDEDNSDQYDSQDEFDGQDESESDDESNSDDSSTDPDSDGD